MSNSKQSYQGEGTIDVSTDPQLAPRIEEAIKLMHTVPTDEMKSLILLKALHVGKRRAIEVMLEGEVEIDKLKEWHSSTLVKGAILRMKIESCVRQVSN